LDSKRAEHPHKFAICSIRVAIGCIVTNRSINCSTCIAIGDAGRAIRCYAALPQDLDHRLNPQGETPSARGVDDTHQYFAIPYLRGSFNPAVLEPIRLYVDAKRYLCATDVGCWGVCRRNPGVAWNCRVACLALLMRLSHCPSLRRRCHQVAPVGRSGQS